MPIRFGFAGLDHWYNAIPTLEQLTRRTDARVVAISHRDPARAREIGDRFGVPVLPGYEEVIARDDVDVICVFTSTDDNAAVSLRAVQAGKAVLAIKPVAMTLAEADTLAAAVRERGVHYFPNDAVRRFTGANVQVQAWIREGRIGDPVAGYCVFRAGLPQEWPGASVPGWFADPARAAGGAFIDHAVYHVDLLRWLFGSEVSAVTGMIGNVRHREIAMEDFGHAVLRFAGGQMGSIEDTWTSGPGASKEALEIVGTRGSIISDTVTGRLSLTGDTGFSGWLQVAPPAQPRTYLDHVVRVMQGEEAPATTIADARANLAACLAVYEAARTGREVALPAPEGATA